MLFRILCMLVALMIVVASEPGAPSQEKSSGTDNVPKQVKEDLGEQTVAILSGATKVDVFRLDKKIALKATPKTIGADQLQFMITATGKERDKEFVAKVRAVLFDEATRELSGASGFRGDVAYRLWKEKESVTVIIDFQGSQFLVVPRDADGKEGKVAFGGFLLNPKLFKGVKELAVTAFPDDAKLKALKEVRVEGTDLFNPPVEK
jgi:hypothetical protein